MPEKPLIPTLLPPNKKELISLAVTGLVVIAAIAGINTWSSQIQPAFDRRRLNDLATKFLNSSPCAEPDLTLEADLPPSKFQLGRPRSAVVEILPSGSLEITFSNGPTFTLTPENGQVSYSRPGESITITPDTLDPKAPVDWSHVIRLCLPSYPDPVQS